MYILHQNISGLLNKSDELSIHLEDLEAQQKSVDIIGITEHNMTEDNQALLTIANFSLATSYCRDKRRGGTCIMVRSGIRYRVLNNIKKMSVKCVVECCAVELTDCGMIVVCVYRVPGTCLDTFHGKLENILNIACIQTNKSVVICGDFNIDTLKQTSNSREFIYQLLSYNLKLQFNQATRLCSGTCLDNFAHNMRGSGEKCWNSVYRIIQLSY